MIALRRCARRRRAGVRVGAPHAANAFALVLTLPWSMGAARRGGAGADREPVAHAADDAAGCGGRFERQRQLSGTEKRRPP